jgi:type IX secretion system PorP/SprF family membrane protein
MRKKFSALLILISLFYGEARSQDPQFSQFYAAPLYLNPAFAGSTELARVGVNYRNQWPSLAASFVTYSGYFDYYFDDYNSGVGLLFLSDKEGLAGLNTNSVALQYTYQFRLTQNLVVRPALQGSFSSRSIDFENLVFADQINIDGQWKPVTDENFNADWSNNFFDVGAGVLAYTSRFWVGFAAHHLLEPDQSFLEDVSVLPRKYSVHLGYKILLPTSTDLTFASGYRDVSITPTAQYKQQGQFSQLDVGTYFTYEPVVFGVWYRGVPFKPLDGNSNNESIVFLAGITSGGLNIGYSFDYTISKLGIQSGGAHEVSVSYEFFWGDPKKPAKNIRELPCPRF